MFKKIAIAVVALIAAEEAQAVQIRTETKNKMDAQVENYLNAESGSKAEWGFLKNIVNIDRFFDSGVKA